VFSGVRLYIWAVPPTPTNFNERRKFETSFPKENIFVALFFRWLTALYQLFYFIHPTHIPSGLQ
jgi:hypothetical protein